MCQSKWGSLSNPGSKSGLGTVVLVPVKDLVGRKKPVQLGTVFHAVWQYIEDHDVPVISMEIKRGDLNPKVLNLHYPGLPSLNFPNLIR